MKQIACGIVMAISTLLIAGCHASFDSTGWSRHGRTGETMRSAETVALAKAAKSEMVIAEFQMAAGELDLSGGAKELFEGEFIYNVASWKPTVHFDDSSFRGRLRVEQPKSHGSFGSVKNEWRMKLTNTKPLDLRFHCGAGENRIDLRDLRLQRVEVHMGAGTVDMDLRIKPERDVDVRIDGGVGEARVRVPADAAIVASASGGIGEIDVHGLQKDGDRWVSPSYRKAQYTIRLNVHGGIGAIHISAE